MRLIFLISILVLISYDVFSQNASVEIKYTEKNDTLSIAFFNFSEDTLYLFNTYLEKPYIYSDILHRIDRKNKIYKISFLPLLPYLTGYLTDRLVLNNPEKILMSGQNLYSFIEVQPKDSILLKISSKDIFKRVDKNKNVCKVFDNNTVRAKKINKITLCKQKGEYELLFEFAIYKKIDLLVNREKYINGEHDSYRQTLNYKTICISIDIANINFPVKLK